MKNVKHLMHPVLAAGLVLTFSAASRLLAQADSSKSQSPPEARPAAPSQGQSGQPAGEDRGNRLMGTVTTVGVDRFEVKRMDGTTQTIMVNEQTHYRQDQKDIHLEDLKPGDPVFVRAQIGDDKDVVAAVVTRLTEEDIQRREQMRGHRAFGQIVSIDGNQLKIQNSRQGDTTVVVSDQTTFMKEGQTITLKDLKVGDRIFALGDETNGQFAATRVFTGQTRRGEGSRPVGAR